ncbi:hypothetical protein Ancab_027915 [Ancistrocladus abbreviatus]
MEPKLKSSFEEEEFYEEIEAPKFVDFTLPDHYSPDDRYWFCSRVGCDQKHEEEMNSEEIYKNFVLRVMAARSPNVRLQRALNKRVPSKKCPFSAPPKPSKSRISRLAVVSTISQKVVNGKGVTKPPPKPCTTPKARVKHVAAKYMTSPRSKKEIANSKRFQSVRNPERTSTIAKNKVAVAKALVFNSPQKPIKAKAFEALNTPLTRLCEKMKNLELTSQKEEGTQKALKDNARNHQKGLFSDALSKQPHPHKVKTGNDDSSCYGCKGQKVKSSKLLKSNFRGDVHTKSRIMPRDDSSNMDIEVKAKNGALEVALASVKSSNDKTEGYGMDSTTVETSRNISSITSQGEASSSSDRPSTEESSNKILSDSLKDQMGSLPNSEQSVSVEDNTSEFQALNVEGHQISEENKQFENLECNIQKEDSAADHSLEIQISNRAQDGEWMDDDKENALASNKIRDFNVSNAHSGKGESRKHDKATKTKVTRTLVKTLKENSSSVGAQVGKNRRPKPTNPKPFRLRTDERRILKEATLERKLNLQEAASENSQRGFGNDIQVNAKCNGQIKSENNTAKGIRKDLNRRFKKDTPQTAHQKPIKEMKPDSDRWTPQRRVISLRQKVAQIKQGKEGKEDINPKPSDGVSNPMNNKAMAAQRSASKGRKPATISKEPSFHSLRAPKSCTRNSLGIF